MEFAQENGKYVNQPNFNSDDVLQNAMKGAEIPVHTFCQPTNYYMMPEFAQPAPPPPPPPPLAGQNAFYQVLKQKKKKRVSMPDVQLLLQPTLTTNLQLC